MSLRQRWVDLVVERLLRPFVNRTARTGLAPRIQRAAFALAMLLVGVLGLTILALQITHLRDTHRASQETNLRVTQGDIRAKLDGVVSDLRFLSRSSLIWTAITDSAGRDSYLRPYLKAYNDVNRVAQVSLLDYRGRIIVGQTGRPVATMDRGLRALMDGVLRDARPASRLATNGRQLVMVFPVLFPYTRDVIGLLQGEVDLVNLVGAQARTLGRDLGVALAQDGRELMAYPSAGARHDRAAAVLASSDRGGLYRFDIEVFRRESQWPRDLMPLLSIYLITASLLVWFAWESSRRLAEGLTRRLDRLANSVSPGGDPDAVLVETVEDEISTLARVLKESFRANRELTQHLEVQVASRTRQLAESEALYRFLAESIKDVVWTLDTETMRFLYVSPSVERLRGYRVDEILAKPLDASLTPEGAAAVRARIRTEAAAYLAGTTPPDHFYTSVIEQPCKGGGSVWTEVLTNYRLDAKTGHVIVVGVTRDISERKRAEELERYSAFQAGVSEMSVSVLHNIGNAITAVLSDTQALQQTSADLARIVVLLERNLDDEANRLASAEPTRADVERQLAIVREVASVIRRLDEEGLDARTRRIAASVQHIAEIVRIQQSASTPVDSHTAFALGPALHDALVMQEEALRRDGITVTVRIDPDLGTLSFSRNRLLQALLNVIKNAQEAIRARRDAAHHAGRIWIDATALDGDRFRLRIRDNGIGLDPEQRAALFRFGYSTKARGSGFGLHTTALFVQELGGRIALESDGPDQGATLEIILPRTLRRTPQAGADTPEGGKP